MQVYSVPIKALFSQTIRVVSFCSKGCSTLRKHTRVLSHLSVITMGIAAQIFAQPPDSIVQKVSNSTISMTLHMYKSSVRAPNFGVRVYGQSGYTDFDPGEVRTYLGTVEEYPDAVAAGVLNRNGQLETRIFLDRGKAWTSLGSTLTAGSFTEPAPKYPTDLATYISPKKSVYRFVHGLDMTSGYFNNFSSDTLKVVDQSEFHMIKIMAQYVRDALLMPTLGRLIIRTVSTSDPYSGLGLLDALYKCSSEWKSNQSDAKCWSASVVPIGGGAGYGEKPGKYSAWGALNNGNFEVVGRHEMGHNWDVADYQSGSPEGPTIECGNSISRHDGMSVGKILGYRDKNIANFDSVGYFKDVAFPPYARLDVKAVYINAPTTFMDVLENDLDCNGHALSLQSFDTLSKNGTTLTRSVGTGPGGRDQITFGKPAASGLDYFYYKVACSAGKIATGAVVITTTTSIVNTDGIIASGNRILPIGRNTFRIAIITKGKFSVDVFNPKGIRITSQTGTGPVNTIVKAPSASSGVYLFIVKSAGRTGSQKVIISN